MRNFIEFELTKEKVMEIAKLCDTIYSLFHEEKVSKETGTAVLFFLSYSVVGSIDFARLKEILDKMSLAIDHVCSELNNETSIVQ